MNDNLTLISFGKRNTYYTTLKNIVATTGELCMANTGDNGIKFDMCMTKALSIQPNYEEMIKVCS